MRALVPGKGDAMHLNSLFAGRYHRRFLTTSAALVAFGLTTAAAEELPKMDVSREAVDDLAQPQAPHFLPGSITAEMDRATSAVGTGWAGYNGATDTPVFSSTAEVWLVPRFSLLAGFGTTPQPGKVSARAQGGARLLVLEQRHHGVNAGVGFLYRQDRFANEEGMLEWSAMVSRHFGATLVLANLVYAQDGEGDDREGEIRLVGMQDLKRGFHVGLDNRLRKSLGSSDPHRAQHANPVFEFNAGPMLAYTISRWSFMMEAGISGQKVDQLRTGTLVLGGVGASF
jgi:hypothetical protein